MYDSILYYSKIAEKKSGILKDLGFLAPNYYLVTLHRAENTDDPKKLKLILRALNEIGRKIPVVFPIHPRTKKMIHSFSLLPYGRSIRWIDPVSYFDMLSLERQAKAILTDSGGVQKEAYWFGVPCFTLREETEWVETVRSGWNVLVGTATRRIVKEVSFLPRRKPSSKSKGIFGDGRASRKMIQALAGLL